MFKPVLTLAAVGFLGIGLWKVLSILFVPFLGTLLGVVLTLVKVALIVGLVMFAFWWFTQDKKKDKTEDGEAPAS
jgi:type IV secretory pathway TrbL component